MTLISIKSLASALIVATLSFGVVSTTAVANDDVKTALAEAKKATDAAKKAGFAWRDWGKMYKKVETAMKDGKTDRALKIAKQLASQGAAAQKQADLAKTAAPRF